jgi:aminoglycoside phosphotransferase (APT) family kinase protein
MKALSAAGLPVPHVLSMSDAAVIDGRPYVLVEAIAGDRIEKVIGTVPADRLAKAAVNVLKRMHELPLEQTGIAGEEAIPLDVELMRWARLMERAPVELTRESNELFRRLLSHRPPPRVPTLVHGDYHYGNMLFRDEHVVGVVDWEIAQLGQPLIDLACLSVVSQVKEDGADLSARGRWQVEDDQILDAYGVEAEEYRWYVAMSYYKYASILGYNLMLHRRGKRIDPVYEERASTIGEFIHEGILRIPR